MATSQPKSLLLAYLLWFFFGLIGAHKCYLRQPGLGIVYVLTLIIGLLTTHVFIGFIMLAFLAIAWLADIVLIPARVLVLNTSGV